VGNKAIPSQKLLITWGKDAPLTYTPDDVGKKSLPSQKTHDELGNMVLPSHELLMT
jgi:hypothetical protein